MCIRDSKMVVLSNQYLHKMHKRINDQEFVFFTKGDNVAILNKVMQYVQNNETTKRLKIVNIKEHNQDNDILKKDIEVLDLSLIHIFAQYFHKAFGIFGGCAHGAVLYGYCGDFCKRSDALFAKYGE